MSTRHTSLTVAFLIIVVFSVTGCSTVQPLMSTGATSASTPEASGPSVDVEESTHTDSPAASASDNETESSTSLPDSAEPPSEPTTSSEGGRENLQEHDSTSSESNVLESCSIHTLTVSLSDVTHGDESSQYALVFTNTSNLVCTIVGTPKVTLVAGGEGTQIGPRAVELPSSAPSVSLMPGQSVTTTITSTPNQTDECDELVIDGLRVYPPQSNAAFFVPLSRVVVCENALPTLEVTAIS